MDVVPEQLRRTGISLEPLTQIQRAEGSIPPAPAAFSNDIPSPRTARSKVSRYSTDSGFARPSLSRVEAADGLRGYMISDGRGSETEGTESSSAWEHSEHLLPQSPQTKLLAIAESDMVDPASLRRAAEESLAPTELEQLLHFQQTLLKATERRVDLEREQARESEPHLAAAQQSREDLALTLGQAMIEIKRLREDVKRKYACLFSYFASRL